MKMSLVLGRNEVVEKTNTDLVQVENRSPLVPEGEQAAWTDRKSVV